MNTTIYDLLMITSFDLDALIDDYRIFFMSLLPGVFLMACLLEYFDRMDVFNLVKRALISVLILTSVTSFYKSSIVYSIDAASAKFEEQKQANILLMDMFEAGKYLDKVGKVKSSTFFKDSSAIGGALKFIKYHFFGSFINDGFTVTVYFLSQLCFVLLKVVFSLVYYLGFGLVGIPCLVYLFPTMGNVLRGGILSFLWCLIVPHVLVFILSMIGSEINAGYQAGQVIGGSATGTVFLFILTLFIAFTPFITMMLINGSGIAQAGGIIALLGGNFIKSLPSKGINAGATVLSGGSLGPKMTLAGGALKLGAQTTGKGIGALKSSFNAFRGGGSSAPPPSSTGSSTSQSTNLGGNSSSATNTNSSSGPSMNMDTSSQKSTQVSNSKGGSNVYQKEGAKRSGDVTQHRRHDSKSQKTNNLNRSSRSDFKSNNTKPANNVDKPKSGGRKV